LSVDLNEDLQELNKTGNKVAWTVHYTNTPQYSVQSVVDMYSLNKCFITYIQEHNSGLKAFTFSRTTVT